MDYIQRFKNRMQYSGGSLKNEHINDSRKLLEYTFGDDPSHSDRYCFWYYGVEDIESEPCIDIRVSNRKHSNANGDTCEFDTQHDVAVEVGDVLYDKEEKMYYLCTESFNLNNVQNKGKLTRCNWMLKWQDRETREILEYPCYNINATQYNSGETDNRQFQIGFTIGSSQHIIQLPCDENTIMIDNPMRFFLDKNMKKPTAFIVTQNDTASMNILGRKGIVRVTVAEDVIRDKDNIELGICDYIEPDSDTPEEQTGDTHVKITYDTACIKSGGDSQTFTGGIYDSNGQEVSGSVEWEIVCDFENKLEVSRLGNSISIGIDNDYYVDEQFKLICKDTNSDNQESLIITVESLL